MADLNVRQMKKVAFLIVILAAFALTTGAKVVWNAFHDSENDPSEVFSDSAAEARRDGILISNLVVAPPPSATSNHNLIISEAWIERCAVHRYSFIWLHRRVPTGGAIVVIKLKKPVDPRFSLWPPERKASFGWIGGECFVRYFESEPEFPMIIVGGKERDLVPVLTLRKPNQAAQTTPGLRPSVSDL